MKWLRKGELLNVEVLEIWAERGKEVGERKVELGVNA